MSNSPNDLDEFSHGDVVRHEELGLVKQREVTLAGVTLNDHRHFVGVLLTDLLYIALPLGCRKALLVTAVHCKF